MQIKLLLIEIVPADIFFLFSRTLFSFLTKSFSTNSNTEPPGTLSNRVGSLTAWRMKSKVKPIFLFIFFFFIIFYFFLITFFIKLSPIFNILFMTYTIHFVQFKESNKLNLSKIISIIIVLKYQIKTA